MRSKTILALVLLNVALLASLCFRDVFSRTAHAQVGGAALRPSEYLMITGDVQGGNAGFLFIVDTRNNLLGMRTFDGKRIDDFAPIDLSRVFKPASGRP